jgi:hypothetical protein
MKQLIECTTQAEVDAATRDGNIAVVRNGLFVASGSATVEAWDSATVRASGSATVRASGSATVEASDSATVEARGSATVRASGSATVEATPYVAIHVASKHANVTGGVQIVVPDLTVPANWCAYNGLTNDAGLTVVYKALDDDWRGQRKTDVTYEPGSMPEAPDWDPDPTRECGGGLHACASPRIAKREYHPTATRFVAIPVGLDDMVLVGERPNKVRFRNAAGPIVEVDIDGKPVAS